MIVIRVLILSNDALIRAGLSVLLPEEATIEVIGQVGLAQLGEGLIDLYRPDVLLVDDDSAVPLLNQQVIALDLPYIRLVDDRIIHSKRGFEPNTIQRNTDLPTLSAALHAVVAGLTVYSQEEGSRSHFQPDLEYPKEGLTAREDEVLQLIGQGMTNRAIGQELSIKESTVKYHVNGILAKLGAQSRTEALAIASKIGWITY